MMHGWFGVGGPGAGLGIPQFFQEDYHCYSVAYADKAHLEKGDKILLPPSAFETLARLQVDYPMLFQLRAGDRSTHCGVLEFTAEEGCVYIPFWMMQNLLIEEGSLITVRNVSLPKATFVKLQPQSVDFLEISNPRAVLEHALRNYSCVTIHDIIQIPYNGKNYQLELKDVQPAPAACIIETDCNVDFDAPVGYQEPMATSSVANSSHDGRGDTATTTGTATSSLEDSTSTSSAHPTGVRIVNGVVVRPETTAASSQLPLDLLAERTGSTGVQPNAAITQQQAAAAPAVEYWAVAAGTGNRLDGKTPTPLKAANGEVLNVEQLRAAAAEAAAKRAATAGQDQSSLPKDAATGDETTPVALKRKSKVGSKYSRLKQTSAFQGDAKTLHK